MSAAESYPDFPEYPPEVHNFIEARRRLGEACMRRAEDPTSSEAGHEEIRAIVDFSASRDALRQCGIDPSEFVKHQPMPSHLSGEKVEPGPHLYIIGS